MSKKILFLDAFSTIHVGNGALLDNSFKIASHRFNTDKITIVTSDIETNKGRYERLISDVFSTYPDKKLSKAIWAISYFANCSLLYIYQKLNIPQQLQILDKRFKKISEAIAGSDIVISISGESINDHFAPQMYMRCYLFYLCIHLGKEFYVFPQSIGPIYRNTSKMILRLFLSKAKTIFCRDNESLKLSQSIWKNGPVEVIYCPDVAVLQESVKGEHLSIFETGKKVIGLALSDAPNEIPGSDGYYENMVNAICGSLDPEKHCILLMPSNYKIAGTSPDYKICARAYEEFLSKNFEVEILENKAIHPEQYQGIQKALHLFISSRMHVGILSTSAGIPTIMLNTQHKIRGYMENIKMQEFVIEYDEVEKLLPTLVKKCLDPELNFKIRSSLTSKNQEMRRLVMQRFSTT